MIYPKDFENKIGFSPIRSLLKEKCETEMGKVLVDRMDFLNDWHDLKKELGKTDEMKNLLESGLSLPQFSFYNIPLWLAETRAPGSYLSSEQLHKASLTFRTMKEMSIFFCNEENISTRYAYLKSEFKDLPVFDSLEKEISNAIDKEAQVKDNASPELFEIRRNLESLSKSMHNIMRRVMDNFINQGLIDKETSPSLREGRLVIPVNSSNKRGISGIIHDTSSTGKTVFIEPSEVVEAGNRIRELKKEEELEIIKILTYLTDSLRPHFEEIKKGCSLLSRYDFIKAKANIALETDGELPVLEKYPEIDWYHAVHPGLFLTLKSQGREVVAMNINLNEKNRILIISGPNAGGKSVSLKTVGTVQYMMQCGMLPTLYSNSHMGIFDNIFIDIGDEQSMENDLSTYSSHLANMKFFLQKANKKTLILADEMGSGTEPQIGAALSQSILEELGNSGCFGVITTHYQNLKIFAEHQEGFVNGAMLYDRQHFRPTFQLSIGDPGSSFAMEIAKNIGIPLKVIDKAKEIVGTEYVDAEKFTLDIQRDKRYWKNKRLEIKEKENRLNRILEEYEKKADDLKQQRANIIKEAKQEAKEILKGANSQIERSIHEIRKSQAEKEKSKEIRRELEEYKKSIEEENSTDKIPDVLRPLKHKSRNKKKETSLNSNYQENYILKIGDYVKMADSSMAGKIISIKGNKAEVAFGNLRTKLDLEKLMPAKEPKPVVAKNYIGNTGTSSDAESRDRQLNFKTDIDIRGFRAEEALQAITYFLDDAIQFNAKRVRILHGTGHGILRSLIREQLKSNSSIKDFHDEDVRFGGAGITVIDLD